MRKALRALLLVLVSIVGAVVLAASSVFGAAFAFGAIGLLVPGTGTPNANNVSSYLENARDRYMQGTACNNSVNCGTVAEGVPNPTLEGIDYPASFWPLSILPSWCRSGPNGCDKWNVSVGQGAEALTTALTAAFATPEDDIVVFGYSQGGAVVAKVLNEYGLTEAEKARLRIVTIGGIQNPDGGLWQRLAFLGYIPILDITFGPPMPVDPAIKTTTYGFEYDPVVYAPRYWGNPFAMLNALAGFVNVHGYYLAPNGNGPTDTLPYGYTPATLAPHLVCTVGVNCRLDQYGNEYIMIPATSLPIMNLVMALTPDLLKPVVKPIVDLVSPVYKVLADLGYDWSGNPGTPTPLSILPFNPFQNWGDVAYRLAVATVEGVHAFLGNFGIGSATLAPASVPNTSLLAARTLAAPSDEDQLVSQQSKDVAKLASVTELKPAAVEDGKQPPVTESGTGELDSTEGAEAVVPTEPVTEPVTEVVETVEAQTPPVETVTETEGPATDDTTVETTKPEQTKPVEKDEPSTSVKDADKSETSPAKDETKKSDTKKDEGKKADTKDDAKTAKPAKKAGDSDNKDSGSDDKKAAA